MAQIIKPWVPACKPPAGTAVRGGRVLSAGLMDLFSFAEGGGVSAGNASNPSRVGAFTSAAWDAGPFGPVARFNTAGYITVTPGYATVGNVSFAAWVNAAATQSGTGGYGPIVELTNSFGVRFGLFINTGGACAVNAGGTFELGPALNDNKWHHLVGVWDGSARTLYVDGVKQTLSGATGSAGGDASIYKIGTFAGFANAYLLTGQIDHVAVYGRAVGAAEAQALYLATYSLFGNSARYWFAPAVAGSISGTSALTAGAAAVASSGAEIFSGNAAVGAAAASAAATGGEVFSGTASVSGAAAGISGTGQEVFSGTAAVTAAAASMAAEGAAGLQPVTGTAAVAAGPASLSASGTLLFSATGAVSAGPASLAGSGAQIFSGGAAVSAGVATLAASGTYTPQAITGASSLAALVAIIAAVGSNGASTGRGSVVASDAGLGSATGSDAGLGSATGSDAGLGSAIGSDTP